MLGTIDEILQKEGVICEDKSDASESNVVRGIYKKKDEYSNME